MEITPVSRTYQTVATEAAPKSRVDADVAPAVVTAVRAANKSELLGDDRQLLFARDHDTGASVIQIVERNTGKVLDQIPPEEVLRILANLTGEREHGEVA